MSEQADAVPEYPQKATPAVQAQAEQPAKTSAEAKVAQAPQADTSTTGEAAQPAQTKASAPTTQAKVSTTGASTNGSQAQAGMGTTGEAAQAKMGATGKTAQPAQTKASTAANVSQAQTEVAQARPDTAAKSQAPQPSQAATGQLVEANVKGPRLIDHMQWGWLAVFVLAVCFIWGNSMRQGVDSSHLSNEAFFMIQGILADFGLPYSWLTDHIVRKTAHFTEYTALGIIAMQAFTPHRDKFCWAALGTFLLAVLAIPCLDETLQLFVDGRSGQVSDVLLDCSGILFGSILTLAAGALYVKARAHRASRPDPETAADPLPPTPVLS